MGKLRALDIARLGVGFHADGDGLYLSVTSADARSWVYRYMLRGEQRYMGLGTAKDIGLKEARELRDEQAKLKAKGIDPLMERDKKVIAARAAAIAAESKKLTFKEATSRFIAANRDKWTNPKHAQQVEHTLKVHAYPVFGDLPLTEIDRAKVREALAPIWKKLPETARRVRQRIEMVFDHALAFDDNLKIANPAERKPIQIALGEQADVVKHHAALNYREMPSFVMRLRESTSVSARALDLLVLCASRTQEVIGAKWDEIDWDGATWEIPAERMKGKKGKRFPHIVPLSPAALKVLQQQRDRRENRYIFPGLRAGKPLSNMALLNLLQKIKYPDITSHGFRSSFRDWAGNQISNVGPAGHAMPLSRYDAETIEFCLAHGITESTVAAYRRETAIEKRRVVLSDWADYCSGAKVANVVPIRA